MVAFGTNIRFALLREKVAVYHEPGPRSLTHHAPPPMSARRGKKTKKHEKNASFAYGVCFVLDIILYFKDNESYCTLKITLTLSVGPPSGITQDIDVRFG